MTDYAYTAAPVFAVDGAVQGELARDVVRLEVEEDTGGLKRLDARFVAVGSGTDAIAGDVKYVDGAVLDFGRTLRVSLGPENTQRIVFEGAITAVELEWPDGGSPLLRVLAEDRLMDLRMTRRSRTYEDVTDAGVAEQIAAAHGLRCEITADGPRYDVLQQINESDLAFLRARAHAIAAELWILDGTLHMATRSNRDATSITLVRGNDLVAAQLSADLARQCTAVRMTGYDADRRRPIDELAGSEVVDAEIAGGRTGPAILRDAVGDREAHIARSVPLTSEEAGAWARAEMLRRSRGFVSIRGTTSGTADLVVGSRLRLERVGGPFEGDGYYVTHARHTFDNARGYRTQFTAERATLGEGVAA